MKKEKVTITFDKVLKISKEWAKKQGCKLNPDKKTADTVINGLILNEKKYGYRFCPCMVVTGNRDKDRLIECPCAYAKKDLKEKGHCHCYLFVKK